MTSALLLQKNRVGRREPTSKPLSQQAPGALARTPLHYAAMKGRTETARFLVDAGAELDAKDQVCGAPTSSASPPSNPLAL